MPPIPVLHPSGLKLGVEKRGRPREFHLVARQLEGVRALPVAAVDVPAREAAQADVVARAVAGERVQGVRDAVGHAAEKKKRRR